MNVFWTVQHHKEPRDVQTYTKESVHDHFCCIQTSDEMCFRYNASGVFADQCANTSPLEMDSLLEPRVKKVHVSFSVLEIAAFFFFCGQLL